MQLILAVTEIMLDVMIQALVVSLIIRFVRKRQEKGHLGRSALGDSLVLVRAMVLLYLGHMLQIGLWAVPFRVFGEFDSFGTAFYHSAVNYTSLGYGDIVMSEGWRVLGALEAASGVLMFGVSTATFFALMTGLMKERRESSRRAGSGAAGTAGTREDGDPGE